MKKIFAFVLAMIMAAGSFSSCGATTAAIYYDSQNDTNVTMFLDTDLVSIPGSDYLKYSFNTHTVYYVFRDGTGRASVGYMAPYIRNGHICEYIAGEIVEIIPTEKIEDATN